jgi:hypothetical protein
MAHTSPPCQRVNNVDGTRDREVMYEAFGASRRLAASSACHETRFRRDVVQP